MSDPLSVAGSAVGIISLGLQVIQSLYDYYTAFKSQNSDIAYMLQVFADLLEILESLGDLVVNRKFKADEESLLKKIESLVGECEECIQELQDEAIKFKATPVDSIQSAFKTTTRRLAYPFRKSTLEKLHEDVDEITSRLTITLQMLQQKGIDRVQDDMEDAKALLHLVRFSQTSSKLLAWLKAPDATINFNEACSKKHPRTGLWLVKGPTYDGWLERPNSFLWLRGFAGCGKSVLCSTAIQYAFRHRRSDPRTGLSFFFFTFNDVDKQDASAMILALILQLSTQLGDYDDLSRLHGTYSNASPPEEALLSLLHQLVRRFANVYILLDALDESPRDTYRQAMLQVIRDIRAWQEPGMHLLVTSRDEPDIREELEATAEETVKMKNAAVDQDIANFIAQHLRENRRLRRWHGHYDKIQKTLTDRANGVFRWVESQFKSLADCPPSPHLLDQLLQSLPQSLDETYARMLKNIAPGLRDYARQMLIALCCAVRPLRGSEFIDVLAFELGDTPTFDINRRFDHIDALQDICPGFTEVDIDPDTEERTIRIAHFSVREYLESERILSHQGIAQFHVRNQDGHTHMASVCLALLLEPQIARYDNPHIIKAQYPLAEYAARYWPQHLERGTLRGEVEAQILRLFQDVTGAFSAWVQIWNIDTSGKGFCGDYTTPIYYAALLGLTNTLRTLLEGGRPISRLTLHAPTPVLQSSPTSLELINAEVGEHGTALQAAVYEGHVESAKVLIAHGADKDAFLESSHYGWAMWGAAKSRDNDLLRFLQEIHEC